MQTHLSSFVCLLTVKSIFFFFLVLSSFLWLIHLRWFNIKDTLVQICVYRSIYIGLFYFLGFYCGTIVGTSHSHSEHIPSSSSGSKFPPTFPLFYWSSLFFKISVFLSDAFFSSLWLSWFYWKECPPPPWLFEVACSYITVLPHRISSLFLPLPLFLVHPLPLSWLPSFCQLGAGRG